MVHGFVLLSFLLVVLSVNAWEDSSNNIHIMQVFDSHLTLSQVETLAPQLDFVWGAESTHVNTYRAHNPDIVVSAYTPFSRDGIASRNLSWWQANHPTLVLYKCDRKTPALYPSGEPNIPLNVADPAWPALQIQMFALPAMKQGYNAMAIDNLSFTNVGAGCGVFAADGTWKQLYSGARQDDAWTAAVLKYVSTFSSQLRAATNGKLAFIPNFSMTTSPSDPNVKALMPYVDGILSELGYTHWGSEKLSQQLWTSTLAFQADLQAQGKAFMSINEWGSTVTPDVLNWIVASWMCGNLNASALSVNPVQGYGFNISYPIFNANVGSPVAPVWSTSSGVFARNYSSGLALVNPTTSAAMFGPLDPSRSYTTTNGHPISSTSPVSLDASTGLVLLASSL